MSLRQKEVMFVTAIDVEKRLGVSTLEITTTNTGKTNAQNVEQLKVLELTYAKFAITKHNLGVRLEKKMPTGKVVKQSLMDMSMLELNGNQAVRAIRTKLNTISFGNNIMDNFQKVILFIISMALGMITELKILTQCLVNPITQDSPLSLINNAYSNSNNLLRSCKAIPYEGISE